MKKEANKKSVYVDANCFIYAALSNSKEGISARRLLEKIRDGFYRRAYTATLTVDEFLWKLQKDLGRELAFEGADIFFSLKNLELVNVSSEIIFNALSLYKNSQLDPHDAIHISAMRSKNVNAIISSDSDFDKLKIERINFIK